MCLNYRKVPKNLRLFGIIPMYKEEETKVNTQDRKFSSALYQRSFRLRNNVGREST